MDTEPLTVYAVIFTLLYLSLLVCSMEGNGEMVIEPAIDPFIVRRDNCVGPCGEVEVVKGAATVHEPEIAPEILLMCVP